MTTIPMLEVYQLSTLAELASLRLRWNELAGGVPLQSWEWLERWWREYGNTSRELPLGGDHHTSFACHKELYLLAVFERPDHLVAIAPWYIEHDPNRGRTLRFLGSGEVCTDYPTVLCQSGSEAAVAEVLARSLSDPLHVADWLTQNSVRHWDRIEFDSVERDNRFMQLLYAALERQNNLVHHRPAEHCWQLELPGSWDEYLARLSKSHRKQVRRLERDYFATGRAVQHFVEHEGQFDESWNLLVRLHQARQRSFGNRGSFSSPAYSEFHRQIARELLCDGRLWLSYLEIDGRAVAAEYHLVGDEAVYAYQGGLDPAALEHSPGQLSLIGCLRRAIAEGYRTFDLLRGDESYKAHWRAKAKPLEDIRIVKRTATNCVRKSLWSAGDQMRLWLKGSIGQTTR